MKSSYRMHNFNKISVLACWMLWLIVNNLQAQKLNQEGSNYLMEHQYQFALECFANQLKISPQDEIAQLGLANSYLALQSCDKAQPLFRKLVDLDAKNFKALIGLGIVAWCNHDKSTEIELFDRARRSDKNNAEVYCAIAEGCLRVQPRDTVAALIYLRQGLDLFPKHGRLHQLAGDLEMVKNNFGLAASAYERAIFFDTRSYHAYRMLGFIRWHSHAFKEALTLLTKSIALEPEQILGYKYLGEVYYLIGKYAEAEDNYRNYLEKAQTSNDDEEQYALILFFNKKYKEAEQLLEQLNEINNDPATLLRIKGYLAFETGEYKKAKEILSQYFAVQKPDKIIPPDNSYMANTLLKLAESSLAKGYFEKAAAMEPGKPELLEPLAKLASQTGSHEQSANWYQKMITLGADKVVNNFLAAKEFYLEGEIWRSRLDSLVNTKKPGPASHEKDNLKLKMTKYYLLSDSVFTLVTKYNSQFAGSYIWKGRIKSILDPEANTKEAKDAYQQALALLESSDPARNTKSIIECYKYLGSYYFLDYERLFQNNKKLAEEQKKLSINCFTKIKELDPTDLQAKEFLKKINDPK